MSTIRYIILFLCVLSFKFTFSQEISKNILQNMNYAEGIRYLDSLIEKESEWNSKKIKLLIYKSNWFTRNNEYDKAQETFLEIPFEVVEIHHCQGDYYLQRAIVHDFNYEPNEAALNYQKAKEFFDSQDDLSAKIYVTGKILEFFRKNRQFEVGIEESVATIQIINSHSDEIEIPAQIIVYSRYAALLNETGKNKESAFISEKALELALKIDDKYNQAILYNELAFAYKNLIKEDQDFFDKSDKSYQKAEEIYRELGLNSLALLTKENRITLFAHHTQNHSYVIELYKEIILEVEEKGINHRLFWVYHNLSSLYEKTGNYKEALHFQRLAEKENKILRDRQEQIELAKIVDEFQSLKLKSENDRIKEENRRKEEVLKTERRTIQLFWIGTALLILILIFLFYLFYQKRKIANILDNENKQKDLLIQEVHHRVKNNLQFITSLLEMQKNTYQNIEESIAMQETISRISSMSLVHGMLYNSSYQDDINLKNYCLELMKSLKDSFNLNDKDIKIELEIDSILISSRQAISIGLIINEFFINSVKYAFFDNNHPIFEMTILKNENAKNFKLEMWDNGPGTMEISASNKKFGLKLIHLLTKSLKAEATWNTTDNLFFSLIVPYEI